MRTGHSHMEVDTVHSAIEKAKNKTKIDIETLDDWVVLISAIKRSVPFDIDELEQRDFRALRICRSDIVFPRKIKLGNQSSSLRSWCFATALTVQERF